MDFFRRKSGAQQQEQSPYNKTSFDAFSKTSFDALLEAIDSTSPDGALIDAMLEDGRGKGPFGKDSFPGFGAGSSSAIPVATSYQIPQEVRDGAALASRTSSHIAFCRLDRTSRSPWLAAATSNWAWRRSAWTGGRGQVHRLGRFSTLGQQRPAWRGRQCHSRSTKSSLASLTSVCPWRGGPARSAPQAVPSSRGGSQVTSDDTVDRIR